MGYETLIIGYRYDDPMRLQADTVSRVQPAGRCGTCGGNVYLNASGVRTMRERDCAIICRLCRHDPELGFTPAIIEAL